MKWLDDAKRYRIDSQRVRLRLPQASDVPEVLALFSDPDVVRYQPFHPWQNLARAQSWHDLSWRGFVEKKVLQWVLTDHEQRFMGLCRVADIDWDSDKAQIGYSLAVRHWGQGYMHEALGAVISFLFEELDMRRLEAATDPRNVPSQRVLTRLGFVEEARRRESRLVKGNELVDEVAFGLLRREWSPRQGERGG